MNSIFVSSQGIDNPPASTLIAALRAKGITVEHSPSNPIDRTDPKWNNWYAEGLAQTLAKCEKFVIVIDEGWDSSSWMGEESHAAMVLNNAPLANQAYYWNPNNVVAQALGMKAYLKWVRLF